MAEMNRVERFFTNALGPRRNARIVRWIQENAAVPAGAACLEVGCGGGDLAGRLVVGLRPAQYVATDLDPRQLDAARKHLGRRYRDGLPSGLELREADMLHLPFKTASFDLAVAIVSLHHASPTHHEASNLPAALAEIDRVLRSGGVLAYEEILHKDTIRQWLVEHGYVLAGVQRGFKRESVVARKPDGTPSQTS